MINIFTDVVIDDFRLSASKLDLLYHEFKTLMPDFRTFVNPGKKFLNHEVNYKTKAINRYQEEIGNELAKKKLSIEKGYELLYEISKRIGTNLVHFNSWRGTFGEDNKKITKALKVILENSEKDYQGSETIEPIFKKMRELELNPNWDTISTLLWAFNPKTYFPIKISYFRKLAEKIGLKLPSGNIDSIKLSKVISFGKLFFEGLKPLQVQNYIDVHSFMWCISPDSYKTDTSNYWIFQANPEKYDIEGALKKDVIKHWLVIQHIDKIAKGDKVIIWVTGKESGCYALTEVVSEVKNTYDDEDEKKFNRGDSFEGKQNRVELQLTHSLVSQPILKTELIDLPEFKKFKGGNQGTNFKATKEQYHKLLEIRGLLMGFITKEDFNLLEKWGGKDYDATNLKHKTTLEQLSRIYQKIEDIGKAIDNENFDINKSATKMNGPGKFCFREYNWGKFSVNGEYRLCITIGMQNSGYFVIKIDTNRTKGSGLTDEQREKYEVLTEKYYNKIVYDIPKEQVIHLSKEELIRFTIEKINKLKQEWNWVYEKVFDEQSKQKGGNQGMNSIKNLSLNTILYGPPGTGKTFKLQNEYFDLFTTKKKTMTKAEYLKSKISEMGWIPSISLAMLDYDSIRIPELSQNNIIKIKTQFSNTKKITATLWARLQTHTPEKCPNVNVSNKNEPSIFWKNDDGSWKIDKELTKELLPEVYSLWEQLKDYKTEEEEERRYEFVTFHQSLSYEEFIEGIKPDLGEEEEVKDLNYINKKGIFFKIAQKASLNPDENWAIFIDEINRGNISNIFGELITLIEEDKRTGNENEMSAILPYSQIPFSIPNNLYIIGTMNTADRSIEAIDTALRRRFSFIEMPPLPYKLSKNVEGIDLQKLLTKINQRLEVLLDKDHLIGHSYFMKVDSLASLRKSFKLNIIPLLEEYFYNDRLKIGLILGEKFVQKSRFSEKLTFGKGFENEYDADETQIYEIAEINKTSVEDFVSIYS